MQMKPDLNQSMSVISYPAQLAMHNYVHTPCMITHVSVLSDIYTDCLQMLRGSHAEAMGSIPGVMSSTRTDSPSASYLTNRETYRTCLAKYWLSSL